MERKTERKLTCGKRRCRSAFHARQALGRYLPTWVREHCEKKPVNKGAKQPLWGDRAIAWAIAVNRARIVAPRKVLDVVFCRIPIYYSR